MSVSEYVTKQEVRKVCKELGLRDWTKIKNPKVTVAEAKKILKQLPLSGMKVSVEDFRLGLEVEFEHGTMFSAYNVTNNHPLLTGMIVMAHFMEMLDYYQRLDVAELEGDLLKALKKKDMAKARAYHKRLARAREELAQVEARQL